MRDLKSIIDREIDQFLEWPTADKSKVTTVSAKLFAEHVARLYVDHIEDVRAMVGEPVAWLWVKGNCKTAVPKDFAEELIGDGESVVSLYSEPTPCPSVSALVEALDCVMHCNEVGFLPWIVQQSVSDALSTYRNQEPKK